ncbi:MAG TPA: TerC family protein [Terriglobia bacterium]|nr:TerC family protein [Terriglobia bacterium]
MTNAAAISLFTLFVLGALALDLGVFQRRRKVLTFRQAILASVVWIALALAFNLGVYFWRGPQAGLEFLTGYVLEISLSLDNVFIFALTFSYSAVPPENQHRVLFWGVVGALVMRVIFIVAGVALVTHFRWVFYIFGGFLVFSGISLFREKKENVPPGRNPVMKLARRLFAVTEQYEGALFFVRRNGRLLATPLFFVLLMIETTDVFMAVDSIPAVLGVTTDSFIVFASNIFAVLGLRALYFVLARALVKFRYLHLGLALVLVFIGTTMLGADFYKLPTRSSLAVICAIISLTIVIPVVNGRSAGRERPGAFNSK